MGPLGEGAGELRGSVAWRRQGPAQRLPASSFQTPAAKLSTSIWEFSSPAAGTALFRKPSCLRAVQRAENKGGWGSAEESVRDGEGRAGCSQVCIYRWIDGQVEKYVGLYFGSRLILPLHLSQRET